MICPNVETTWVAAVRCTAAGRKANGPRMIHAVGTRPSSRTLSAVSEPALAAAMQRTPQPASVVTVAYTAKARATMHVQPALTIAAALAPQAASAEAITNRGMSKTATATGSRLPRVASRTMGEAKTAVHQKKPAIACRVK